MDFPYFLVGVTSRFHPCWTHQTVRSLPRRVSRLPANTNFQCISNSQIITASLENIINCCPPFLPRTVFDSVGVKKKGAKANFVHLSWLGASRGDGCIVTFDLAGYADNLVTQGNWRNVKEMANTVIETCFFRSFQGRFVTDGLLSAVYMMAQECFQQRKRQKSRRASWMLKCAASALVFTVTVSAEQVAHNPGDTDPHVATAIGESLWDLR